MTTFTAAKQVWNVQINVSTLKRVKAETQIDLLNVFDGSLIESLRTDPIKLCGIAYALCKPQAIAAKIDLEAFESAIDDITLAPATNAVLEELANFFRLSRPEVTAMIEKHIQITKKGGGILIRKIDQAERIAMEKIENFDIEAAMNERLLTPLGSGG